MWASGTGSEFLRKLATEKPNMFFHVPASYGWQAVILREEPFVYIGHYVGRGMKPCTGDHLTCRWCKHGFGKKLRAVFSMMDSRTKETGVFEVSDVTAGLMLRAMDEFREMFASARGLAFVFKKEDDKKNGAIRVKCLQGLAGGSDLPEGPDPQHVMVKMWTSPEKADVAELPKECQP